MNPTTGACAPTLDGAPPTTGITQMTQQASASTVQGDFPVRVWVFLDEEDSDPPAVCAEPLATEHGGAASWEALLAAGVRVVPRGEK